MGNPGMDQTGVGLLGADPALIMTLTLNAVAQASHMLLLALGLSLIFGVLRVLNMAHGALHVAGLYVGLSVVQVTGSWWSALILSPLILAAIGAGIEIVLLRPLRGRHPTHALILTFGVILIFQDLFKLLWGVDIKLLAEPGLLSGSVTVFGLPYPKLYLFNVAAAAIVVTLLWLLLTQTTAGRVIRAAAQDPEVAAAVGVPVPLVYTAVFALGTFLTAFGGVLMGTSMSFTPAAALDTMLYAFAIVVIGGLGSLAGAVLGSLLVSFIEAFGLLIAPGWSLAFVFIVMAAVLVVRPHGLLGRAEA
jgi:branched-subunit amino acid ABC-type transport system permease component